MELMSVFIELIMCEKEKKKDKRTEMLFTILITVPVLFPTSRILKAYDLSLYAVMIPAFKELERSLTS